MFEEKQVERFSAKEKDIISLLSDEKTFFIPLYQRSYSWGSKEVDELLNDLEEFIINDEIEEYTNELNYENIYYMGNIILKIDKENNRRILIDGQQRITTYFLFLKALKDVIENKFKDYYEYDELIKRINNMIFTIDSEEEKRIKLSNISGDDKLKEILRSSREELSNKIKEEKELIIKIGKLSNSLFWNNYIIIYEFLFKKIENENDLDNWFNNLFSKINFVCIYITDEEDEHYIFENINSKGKNLSLMDLVKNYLYIYAERVMDNEEEKKIIGYIFDNKIIKYFEKKETESLTFFKQLINYSTGELITNPDIKKLYRKFRSDVLPFESRSKQKIFDFMKLLEKAFEAYKYISNFSKKNITNEFDLIMQLMNYLFVDTYFPLMLRNALINAKYIENNNSYTLIEVNKEFKEVVFAMEEWWLKNELSTENEKKMLTIKIPQILANFKDNKLTREKFLNAVSNVFNIDSWFGLSNDESSKRILIKNDIQSSYIIIHILSRINYEKGNNNIDFSNLVTEYVIPKNISELKCWRNVFGSNWEDKHDAIVNKLGNLTLIERELNKKKLKCFINENSSKKSKKYLYSKSNLFTTKEISKLDEFNEEKVKQRTKKLAEIFFSIYEKW